MFDFVEIKANLTVSDAGEITGIAWPFGTADRVGDVIEPKAFAGARAPLAMLWSHDQSNVLGVWNEISASGAGLAVKGQLLVDSVEKAREVRALVKAGAVNGLSIGFQTKQAAPRKGGGRTISKLDLVEVSIVAVPSHPDARITSAKSANSKEIKVENEVIEGMETKSAEFIALEEKFTSLETKLEEFGVATKRLDKIEARLSRPGISGRLETKEDETEIQRKAFVDYARGGAFDTKALSIAGNGGYLVPPVLLNELQKNLILFSPIRNIARVTSISVPTVTLPKRTANLTGAWVAETGTRTESDPTYAQQSFTAYEYATYIDVSLELLEDSLFDLGQSLMQDIGQEFGRAEGAAFVAGNGTGKPTGFLNAPASGQIVAAAGNAIAPDDIIHLFHALPSFYAQQGVFMANRYTIGLIRAFKSSTGEYLWAPGSGENGLVPGNSSTLLGRPIIEVPDMPDSAPATIALAFGDMQQPYRIVDRISVNVLRDDFTQRATGQVRFHARRRVGGAVGKAEALCFLQTTA
jgi:HK97 family phage major capsid protein/HK97 family phage prohead protease